MNSWRILFLQLLLLLHPSLDNCQEVNAIKLKELFNINIAIENLNTELEEVKNKLNQLESNLTLIPEVLKGFLDEAESRIRSDLEEELKSYYVDGKVKNLTDVPVPVKGSHFRYISHGSLVNTTWNISLSQCGSLCHLNRDCVSFNYKSESELCELLNTAPYKKDDIVKIMSATWMHYVFVAPKRNTDDFDEDELCPAGSFVVWYDQPIEQKYNTSVPGYTCTSHDWVKEQYSNGLTDCRMIMNYDKYLRHHHTGDFKGTYYDALKTCDSKKCIGMTCRTSSGLCYVQHDSLLTTNVKAIPSTDFHQYWYTVCQ